jgi:peptidoglycan/xylan/chitin deacetylase (PgdA/CDA1 family)
MFHRIPKIIQSVYPSLIWERPSQNKTVYLTFDDGPIPEVTEFVLEQLKSFDIKATFFCIGDNIQKHSAIFQQLIQEGHTIGNHTFHHLKGWNTEDEAYLENAEKCQMEINNYSTFDTKLFRPPYGRIKKTQIKELQNLGYEIVMWTTLSQDYRQDLNPAKCLKNTLNATRNGSIVLFHDSLKARKNMEYTLPKYIERLFESGFIFKTL